MLSFLALAVWFPMAALADFSEFSFTMSGGKDVPAFSTTVALTNPLIAWTNPNVVAAIDRTQPLTVTWTGGNTGQHSATFVLGSVTTPLRGRGFTCLTTAEIGQFTVPNCILSALPLGNSGVQLQNTIQLPVAAQGLDIGTAAATISYTATGTIK
jgi:hypothetical protein